MKLFGIGVAWVLLTLAAGNGQAPGLAQTGKTITVCSSGCDYPKIQDAINVAAAGDIIQVRGGTYQENLLIRGKKHLTLIGVTDGQILLKGSDSGCCPDGILISDSEDIQLQGLTISDYRGNGIHLEGAIASLRLDGLHIIGNGRSGFEGESGYVAISNSELRSNRIGVLLVGGSAAISKNSITSNREAGIQLQGGSANIEGNTVSINFGSGIFFPGGGALASITHNQLVINSGYGIYAHTANNILTCIANSPWGNAAGNYNDVAAQVCR